MLERVGIGVPRSAFLFIFTVVKNLVFGYHTELYALSPAPF
jgi:hypothetical protein